VCGLVLSESVISKINVNDYLQYALFLFYFLKDPLGSFLTVRSKQHNNFMQFKCNLRLTETFLQYYFMIFNDSSTLDKIDVLLFVLSRL